MPRKKVESKEVAELGFLACAEIINEIQMKAEDNEGELTDEQMQQLVEAQTQAPAKLHSLCNFLKLLESKEEICKARIAEIKENQSRANDLRTRLCAALAPWVREQGTTYHCQEYELVTRKSTSVKVPDGYDDPFYCVTETKTVVKADKKAIKKALEAGEEVPGCELVEKINLTVK